MNIVGTPRKTVVPVSTIAATASLGSNRSTTATAPPHANVATRPVDWPRTCENGAAPKTTSPGPNAERLGCVARSRLDPSVRENRAFRDARRPRGEQDRRRVGARSRHRIADARVVGEQRVVRFEHDAVESSRGDRARRAPRRARRPRRRSTAETTCRRSLDLAGAKKDVERARRSLRARARRSRRRRTTARSAGRSRRDRPAERRARRAPPRRPRPGRAAPRT